MAIPIWPETLPPYFLVDGFSFGFGNNWIESKPDVGPPKRRRRSSAVVKPVTCAFDGDQNDYLQLLDFYRRVLVDGTLPFWTRDRLLDGAEITDESDQIITTENDVPIVIDAWWLVMFSSEPTMSARGGLLFRISFGLSVLP